MKYEQYFNRIFPIVGKGFMEKSVAVFGADFCSLVAEAFARCGIMKMLFVGNEVATAESTIPLTFGQRFKGKQASKALEIAFKRHNRKQKSWDICHTTNFPLDADLLKKRKIELLVGGGSKEICEYVIQLSEKTGISAVTFSLLKNSVLRYAVFVNAPGMNSALNLINRCFAEKLSGYEHLRRLDWLDASDMAMSIAKALLLRGTEYQRQDFEELLFNQKRNIIFRGTSDWPWTVVYSNPEEDKEWIKKTLSEEEYPVYLPLGVLDGERVMVIGCGTASLFIGEAVNFFGSLFLLDCKKFSVYNPVRQLTSTDYIGRIKPFALQEILMKRIAPSSKSWIKKRQKGILTVTNKKTNFSVSAKRFEIVDTGDSTKQFNELLDTYQPTLVIVAMGRSGENDANFVATRILRERGIKHIIPTAFPSAAYYKKIVVDGSQGPCYDCLHHHLPIDLGDAPQLSEEQSQMFYGGTQPATVMETYPSIHCLLRLSIELCLPPQLRSPWFSDMLEKEKNCFVGGNKAERTEEGWLYGIRFPGQVVTYGAEDIIGCDAFSVCTCGRKNKTFIRLES